MYYEGKNAFKDLGISLPPSLKSAEAMLGWPEKAVSSLAERINFDGFTIPGKDQDPFDLMDLFDRNDMDIELPQAITSALTHSVSFLSVTAGDVKSGEPEVMLLARSARHGAALWDRRKRRLAAALAITDTDKSGNCSGFVLYLPEVVVSASRDSVSSAWTVERRPNRTGRVLVFPLVFRPELDRPFGRSRISRPVMQLTDMAVRTMIRAEVGAEFYASPQRYVLGAEEGAFDGDSARWRAVTTRLLGIGRDEEGNLPEVGQFSQLSMAPHLEQLRSIASAFAGETGLALSSLGIVQDNPSSAEAIYAAKEDLVIGANAATRVMGSTLKQVAVASVMVRDKLTEAPDELGKLQAKWRNPATPSVVSASDAVVKLLTAFPWMAESEVALEVAGFDQAQIARLLADKRRIDARATVQSLGLAAQHLGAQNTPQEKPGAVPAVEKPDSPVGA